jgi:S1-C subfamily serine protease
MAARTLAVVAFVALAACHLDIGASPAHVPAHVARPDIRPDAAASSAVLRIAAGAFGFDGFGSATPIDIQPSPRHPGESDVVLLTARHVVEQLETFGLALEVFPEGDSQSASTSWPVLDTRASPDVDAALVLVRMPTSVADGLKVLEVSTRAPVLGERVLAVGFAWGLRRHVGLGIVCSPATAFGPGLWHVSAAVSPGMSGGAVLDEAGAILGVVVATDPNAGSCIGYAVGVGPLAGWIRAAALDIRS